MFQCVILLYHLIVQYAFQWYSPPNVKISQGCQSVRNGISRPKPNIQYYSAGDHPVYSSGRKLVELCLHECQNKIKSELLVLVLRQIKFCLGHTWPDLRTPRCLPFWWLLLSPSSTRFIAIPFVVSQQRGLQKFIIIYSFTRKLDVLEVPKHWQWWIASVDMWCTPFLERVFILEAKPVQKNSISNAPSTKMKLLQRMH